MFGFLFEVVARRFGVLKSLIPFLIVHSLSEWKMYWKFVRFFDSDEISGYYLLNILTTYFNKRFPGQNGFEVHLWSLVWFVLFSFALICTQYRFFTFRDTSIQIKYFVIILFKWFHFIFLFVNIPSNKASISIWGSSMWYIEWWNAFFSGLTIMHLIEAQVDVCCTYIWF